MTQKTNGMQADNCKNIESKNGMSQVVIDLRPEVKHHEGYGREKVADVYFRTQVRAYSRQVYGDYSQEAHEAAEKALTAFYSEVVELLKGEGWTLLNDYAKWHNCPELAKGAQYLYVHPDSISGEVNPADIDALEAKFKALTACEYRGTDNYGDIILTRSEADERMLYRETYTEGIAATIKECTTTKRSNLYKDSGDALGCIRSRIAIQNKRTDLTGHGTGYYRERKAVAGFVQEEYDRLLQAGYIKEATGQNGRTLCRWINKKEEKELTKTRREAEKAEKVKETYKTGLLVTDVKYGHDYERITGIRNGINTYIVTTATEIQLECMKHYRVMEKAKNEHTIKDLPEWVRPGAVLNIDEYWKWDVVEIVELADGCVWYKKGNSVQGWTYDHFISLYVNHHKANVKEYAPEPTLETIGKIRAAFEADGCTYPGDVEGTREYYRDALLQAADGATVCYQFGNCRFDCKKNDKGTWDVHAYDTNGEDTTFEGRTASFFGGMFNDLFGTWGSGNLPDPDGPTLYEPSEITDPNEGEDGEGEDLTAGYRRAICRAAAMGCVRCCEYKDKRVEVKVAYKNGHDNPEDWTYCVSWFEGKELKDCENGVTLDQAARALAQFEQESSREPEPFFIAGTKYRCIRSVKGSFTKGRVYEQSNEPTQWFGYFRNDKGTSHCWPQPANIGHQCELWDYKPEDIDPRNFFEPVAA